MRQVLTADGVADALVRLCQRRGCDPMAALEPSREAMRVEAAAIWAANNAETLDDLRFVATAFRVGWRALISPVLEMAQMWRISGEACELGDASEPTEAEMVASIRRVIGEDSRATSYIGPDGIHLHFKQQTPSFSPFAEVPA